MKHLKSSICGGLLAVALAMLAGSSDASATVLCSATQTPCGPGNIWPVARELDFSLASGTTTTFATTANEQLDSCNRSTIKGAIGVAGGAGATATVGVPLAGVTWVECTLPTNTLAGIEMEVHATSGTDNGAVTGRGLEVTINTIFFGSCIYGTGAAAPLGTLTGGQPATLDVNAVLSKIAGGIFCPPSIKWSTRYTLTMPSNATLHVEPE